MEFIFIIIIVNVISMYCMYVSLCTFCVVIWEFQQVVFRLAVYFKSKFGYCIKQHVRLQAYYFLSLFLDFARYEYE